MDVSGTCRLARTHSLIPGPQAYYSYSVEAVNPAALCHLQLDLYCSRTGGRTHSDCNIPPRAGADAPFPPPLKQPKNKAPQGRPEG